MRSEPFKLKDVKQLALLQPHQRVQAMLRADYNPLRLWSDQVTFDMVARGTSAWSHYQKAALDVGDEAYAGARNYYQLESALFDLFGVKNVVPTHTGRGGEKLFLTTSMKAGQAVAHNRGRCEGLVPDLGGISVDFSVQSRLDRGPEAFAGDFDLARLERLLKEKGAEGMAAVYVETCPEGRNSAPISMGNLKEVHRLASAHQVPVVMDISCIDTNAWWIQKVECPRSTVSDLRKQMVSLSDIQLMDAAQDARCDIGGFIASPVQEYYERFRNQVVVFEGLHTYGGMTGRAMEVFAVGIRELESGEYGDWHQDQIAQWSQLLQEKGVPAVRTPRGVVLEVAAFAPKVPAEQYPVMALADALYIAGGIRCRMDGEWSFFSENRGGWWLPLDLPRCAYTFNHMKRLADVLAWVYSQRESLGGLRLMNQPRFVDEAVFLPVEDRLLVPGTLENPVKERRFERYRTVVFEPLKNTDRAHRQEAMVRAGYNTFLLKSEDIYIDFLTDSGTAAMSTWQWEGMTDIDETPYRSRSFERLEAAFQELLGFKHIIPTHQGRAAEHIMSQVMIRPGQSVPGNMYFTTTKLHQEMAGGVFVDVIVDEAHDPTSEFPWKGNVHCGKLEDEIRRVGADNVAYLSYEMSVNMAGGQPFSMQNAREVSALCHRHGIPVMFDATRCVENAEMIRLKDPAYRHHRIRDIVGEMMSYGDGCTISCKKDFLVNMGGMLACNDSDLARKFREKLRIWEGEVCNGGMAVRDMEAMYRGLIESMDEDYIRMRIEQTAEFGTKLIQAGVPIVLPPGSHAIFIDARRFLPHVPQDQYTAQALASAIYIETGVRTMERGNVSKGRDPKTGQNYNPKLELVRCTIPRRAYTPSHFDYIVAGVSRLLERRDRISGLKIVYEPPVLRFFQGRFEPLSPWDW